MLDSVKLLSYIGFFSKKGRNDSVIKEALYVV